MLTTLKSTVLALAIGLGAVSGAPAIAQAEGLYFNLGNGQGPSVEVENGDSYRQYPRRGERRYDRRYDRRQENREKLDIVSPDSGAREGEFRHAAGGYQQPTSDSPN